MILIDFLCLPCGKLFEGELFEPVICPRCGNFQPAELKAFRYWQADKHRRIELGICGRHSALVPKVGGCPKCLSEHRLQPSLEKLKNWPKLTLPNS